MEKRRNCLEVIEQMLQIIPLDERLFRSALEWNKADSFYTPPEETIQWERTGSTLRNYIPVPKKEWEFQILSIFSTIPIEELKESLKK